MAHDQMGYEQMARDALRGVVREALRRAVNEGLPGAHHFYISFRTHAPGVDLDESLSEKYPEEMTIVLEHQYWDLAVDEDAFEVTLKFNDIPKYIRVPFEAVTQFADPSVNFGLKFDVALSLLGEPGDDDSTPAKKGESGQVVSLDAFRKKPE